MDLQQLRDQIDIIDNQLLVLLNQRMGYVREVGELKRDARSAIYRPEREKQILDRLALMNKGLLNQSAIEAIFLEIFAVSRNLELPERIAYLGPEGSFTHQAAETRFGGTGEYLMLPTIRSVFDSVETERAKFGVVPIENNQEGVVPESIDLLREKGLHIVAEMFLPIHFTLASQSDNLHHIKRIYSKDIAFRQCSKFLREYFDGQNVELIPVESTSKATRLAAEEPDAAAICSQISAKMYKVPMLFENIEDSDQNRTRFIILSKNFVHQQCDSAKTTIIANLPNTNKPGVLFEFLREFNQRGISLTKIESRPDRIGAEFGFWFLVEFEGHKEDPLVQEIFDKYGAHLKWLGSYIKGN